MNSFKKLENMSIIIIIVFVVACIIAIGKKIKKPNQSAVFQNNLKIDTTSKIDNSSETNIIIVNEDTIKASSNTSIEIIGRRNDSQIKTLQDISFNNDEYFCTTYGWDHGNITWTSTINGTFAYVKKQSKVEKRKCDNFLYGKGAETSKKIKELQNQ